MPLMFSFKLVIRGPPYIILIDDIEELNYLSMRDSNFKFDNY